MTITALSRGGHVSAGSITVRRRRAGGERRVGTQGELRELGELRTLTESQPELGSLDHFQGTKEQHSLPMSGF